MCNSVHVDSTFATVLDKVGSTKRVTVLSNSAIKYGTRRLRTPRGIAVLFLMVAYLVSGVLHGLMDIDVTAPGGRSVMAMSSTKDMDTSGKGTAVEHHCHGCFSVSVPTPLMAVAAIEPKVATLAQPSSHSSGLIPGIDTPPPKLLT